MERIKKECVVFDTLLKCCIWDLIGRWSRDGPVEMLYLFSLLGGNDTGFQPGLNSGIDIRHSLFGRDFVLVAERFAEV